jgi:hypothetical protein
VCNMTTYYDEHLGYITITELGFHPGLFATRVTRVDSGIGPAYVQYM